LTKIIITGGNGFIGTNLALRLLQNPNNKIINIDKFSYCSNSYYITNQNKNFKNLRVNICNLNKIEEIIYRFKPDFVYHLAAETHVDKSLQNPLLHYNNNVKTTLHLLIALDRARKKKILRKNFRFIHVGTDEIYGDLPFNSKKSFDENKSLSPNNPYSASKAAAVLMVEAWYKNFNFPCIITNSVNNFGFFQYVEKFIPRSILTAKKKKIIEVYGQGKNIRSWISAKEHVDALIFLAKKGITGETYNISSQQKIKNIELEEII
jgi:dTDP-glucose 4,6-dehydratase